MLFGLADRLRIPQLLMRINAVVKPNTRPMTREEVELARSVFGSYIDYQKVRLDTRAFIGCRHFGFAYVGFNVINCWGRLTPQHLIHELVHIWQYQSMGSVYIPRALWAQWFGGGYNYGGMAALQTAAENGRYLADFNL